MLYTYSKQTHHCAACQKTQHHKCTTMCYGFTSRAEMFTSFAAENRNCSDWHLLDRVKKGRNLRIWKSHLDSESLNRLKSLLADAMSQVSFTAQPMSERLSLLKHSPSSPSPICISAPPERITIESINFYNESRHLYYLPCSLSPTLHCIFWIGHQFTSRVLPCYYTNRHPFLTAIVYSLP